MRLADQIDVANQLLAKIDIPMLPKEALQLQKLFNDKEIPNPQEVKRLVALNPVLAGELISLANILSTANQNAAPITDLDTAIYRLGYNQLKHFLFSMCIKKQLDTSQIQGLSVHSQNIALIASELARHSRFATVGEAFLLGLIHDIGAFALMRIDPNFAQTFIGKQVNYYSSPRQEFAQYGTTHSAFGYALAAKWELPVRFCRSILLQHEANPERIKEESLRNWVALIGMAHALLFELRHKPYLKEEYDRLLKNSQAVLKIDEEKLKQVRIRVSDMLH